MDKDKLENEKPKYNADKLTEDFSFFCADFSNLIRQLIETPLDMRQRFQVTGAIMKLVRAQASMNEMLKRWGMLD